MEEQVKNQTGARDPTGERVLLTLGEFPEDLDRTLARWGYVSRALPRTGIRAHQEEWLRSALVLLVDGSCAAASATLRKARDADLPSILVRAPQFLLGEVHAGVVYGDWPGTEEVRRAVNRLVSCPAPSRNTPIPTEEFLAWLQSHFGLVFPPRRSGEIKDAVRQRMTALRLPTASSYLERLRRVGPGDREPDHLLDSLLVGETYLYRTPAHYDTLRFQKLPELIQDYPEGVLRVWSAGCSSGEEAYCLAATLLQKLPRQRVDVLGTDIHRKALEVARQGVFGEYSQRTALPLGLQRYLPTVDGRVEATPELRRCTRFEYLNLVTWAAGREPGPSEKFDVIFCRNVLLYFDPPAARRVLEAMARRLRPGGVLFLGPSETVLGGETGLQVRSGLDCFYLELPRGPLASTAASRPKPGTEPPFSFRASRPPLSSDPPTRKPRLAQMPWQRRPVAEPASATGDDDPLVRRAFQNLDEEDFAAARRLFEQARAASPDAHAPRIGLLFLEANDGHYERAKAGCNALVDEGSTRPELFYLLGLLADIEGDQASGERQFHRALYLDMNCFMARFRLAEFHQRKGAVDDAGREAKNLLEQLRKLEPGALVPLSGGMSREAVEALCLGLLSHDDGGRR